MVNSNRNRKNQPPTGQGKRQSTHHGEAHKLEERSEVVQAQRGHPELNLGDAEEETAIRETDPRTTQTGPRPGDRRQARPRASRHRR